MGQTVIATMTFYKSMQEMRAGLALRMAEEARKYVYRLIAVDGGSPAEFIAALTGVGATVHSQKEKGLGPAHRQLFSMPGRTERAWAYYPPSQMHQEKFCNLAMRSMLPAINADWFWGPFAANQAALRHFIQYQGEGYNGRSVPKIHAIAAGLRVRGISVEYIHPPEQTQEETGNLFYDLRRVKQVEQVAAMAEAARELGLIK